MDAVVQRSQSEPFIEGPHAQAGSVVASTARAATASLHRHDAAAQETEADNATCHGIFDFLDAVSQEVRTLWCSLA